MAHLLPYLLLQYKLLAKAYPYMAKRLLTDPAPELRESFEDLILKVLGEEGKREDEEW